jgi:hypothetical protein
MRHARAARAISLALVALVTASRPGGIGCQGADRVVQCGGEIRLRRSAPFLADANGSAGIYAPTMQWPGTSLPGHPTSLRRRLMIAN